MFYKFYWCEDLPVLCMCVYACIPERILGGLVQLACPLLGEGSQEPGLELLQHSE